jgi:ubiquinone biosynthesis protein
VQGKRIIVQSRPLAPRVAKTKPRRALPALSKPGKATIPVRARSLSDSLFQGQSRRQTLVEDIKDRVSEGVERWPGPAVVSGRAGGLRAPGSTITEYLPRPKEKALEGIDPSNVVQSLPRRQFYAPPLKAPKNEPRMARMKVYPVSTLFVVWRVVIWTFALWRYIGGTLLDIVLRRDTERRRAVRMRLILEGLGPTFIKLGQQMSVRADLLPYVFCEELAKMLDSVAPFDVKHAIAAVERVSGRPLSETFAAFDPKAIGSASLACVYKGVLKNGEEVAVKVRRPGVPETLTADVRALNAIMYLPEFFGLVRAGLLKNFRIELTSMFSEELDYQKEARYTELFQMKVEKSKLRYLNAPKVYFELSGDDVLVTEFVHGIFLSELMSAVDYDNQELLATYKSRGIDPAGVARRMVHAFNWETIEGILFHADPHPANIIVRSGNRLTFIDFGSCGHFTRKAKRQWQQLYLSLANEDVTAMTDATINTLEPLPPIDIDQLAKEIEQLYWDWLYAAKSKHSEWWEKASGVMWIKLMAITRQYDVPMNLDSLRLFRATFLYNAVIFRLHPKLSLNKEYQRYYKTAGKRAKKRVQKGVRRRINEGLTDNDYIRIEGFWGMLNQLVTRVQSGLDTSPHIFSKMVNKAAFGIAMMLRLVAITMFIHITATVIVVLYMWITGVQTSVWSIFVSIASHKSYQILFMFFVLIVLRKMRMRIEDIDLEK